MAAVTWLERPQQHDFPAAMSYLSLLATEPQIAGLLSGWQVASPQHYKAKDILRAARLELLPRDNPHVANDLKKIADKVPLSPILLARGDLARGTPLQIADGYHRVCASYLTDENTDIPCLLASLAT